MFIYDGFEFGIEDYVLKSVFLLHLVVVICNN
jgi:hypothetical protein